MLQTLIEKGVKKKHSFADRKPDAGNIREGEHVEQFRSRHFIAVAAGESEVIDF